MAQTIDLSWGVILGHEHAQLHTVYVRYNRCCSHFSGRLWTIQSHCLGHWSNTWELADAVRVQNLKWLAVNVCKCKAWFLPVQYFWLVPRWNKRFHNLSQWPTWCTNFNTFITFLYVYMFRAISCSPSGGQIVLIQHLVSSLSVSDHPVHRLRKKSFLNLCIGQSLTESDHTRCCINTIWPPEDKQDIARNMYT